MVSILFYIPELFGVGIDVYFILILLGIPSFFFWLWLFKKFIHHDARRKMLAGIATVLVTPCIYAGLIILSILIIAYYPKRDFDRKKWFEEKDKRYELSGNIIKSKMLIGKSKEQVRELLGNEGNSVGANVWSFGLGIRPELFNIDDSFLEIQFKNDTVADVEQYR